MNSTRSSGSDYSSALNKHGGFHNYPVYPNEKAFAALKTNGSIATWGNPANGENPDHAPAGTGYTTIYSTSAAFAALKTDGSIATWGLGAFGGSGAPAGVGHTAIYSTLGAFAAIKTDGALLKCGVLVFMEETLMKLQEIQVMFLSMGVPTPPIISSATATATVGVAITPITITNTGGAATSYSIEPEIDVNMGLVFNTNTGEISGTPTTMATATEYTITATNGSGTDTATVTININVAPTTVGTIAAQALTLAGGSQTIGVSGNFSDADGEALTYTAMSRDENIVTVSIDASGMLTLTPPCPRKCTGYRYRQGSG